MTEKEFLAAIDIIYKFSEKDNSEMTWGETKDKLAWLMLEYKEGTHVGWWNKKSEHELILELKEVVKHNDKQMELVDYDLNQAKDVITVEHKGNILWDLLNEETQCFGVNPFTYYGEELVLEMISKYEDLKQNTKN